MPLNGWYIGFSLIESGNLLTSFHLMSGKVIIFVGKAFPNISSLMKRSLIVQKEGYIADSGYMEYCRAFESGIQTRCL